MKKMLAAFIVLATGLIITTTGFVASETVYTRIGKLSFTHDFENGYPSLETQQKLFDEMDFQRACQVYLWSIPIVSMAQWQWSHYNQLGAENGQIVFVESYKDKLDGLTYNTTSPYVLPSIDLAEEPWIAAMPVGKVCGAANDFWQFSVAQMTKPGKYLFASPEQEVPAEAEVE